MRETALKVGLDRLGPGTNLPGTVLTLALQQVLNPPAKGLLPATKSPYYIQRTEGLSGGVRIASQRRQLCPTPILTLQLEQCAGLILGHAPILGCQPVLIRATG